MRNRTEPLANQGMLVAEYPQKDNLSTEGPTAISQKRPACAACTAAGRARTEHLDVLDCDEVGVDAEEAAPPRVAQQRVVPYGEPAAAAGGAAAGQ